MGIIKKLSSKVSNQIAAGEVIIRPAAVLKELLENALDAGATRLDVSLRGAGFAEIRVTDNGKGIKPEDMALALERYATSKMHAISDLQSIQTYGYRGEALASMASVSHMQISSSTKEGEAYICGYANDYQPVRASHPLGTSVSVNNLFYNTPVRRSFLKADALEQKLAERIFHEYAFLHSNVSWRLFIEDRPVAQYAAAESLQAMRLEPVFGSEFVEQHIAHTCAEQDYALEALLGFPSIARGRADRQFLFVNQRPIKDNKLSFVVKKAYRDVLFKGKFPVYFLHLKLPPEELDVNVHPTKQEVRFRSERQVLSWLLKQLEEATARFQVDASQMSAPANPVPIQQYPEETLLQPQTKELESQRDSEVQFLQDDLHLATGRDLRLKSQDMMEKLFQNNQAEVPADFVQKAQAEDLPEAAPSLHPLGTSLAQVCRNFIVAQNMQGLVLVDMHAAHERIIYEGLKKQPGTIAIQNLLIPIFLNFNKHEAILLKGFIPQLADLGFEIDEMPNNKFVLRSMPSILADQDVKQLMDAVVEELDTLGQVSLIQDRHNQILSAIACRSALRFGAQLSLKDMDALLRQLEQTERSAQCNHGRPTWVQFGLEELGAFFLRGK